MFRSRSLLLMLAAIAVAACSDVSRNPVAPSAAKPAAPTVAHRDLSNVSAGDGVVSASVAAPATSPQAHDTVTFTVTVTAGSSTAVVPTDFLILLDGSGSEGGAAFKQAKDGIDDMVGQLTLGPSADRLSVVEFGERVQTFYTFDDDQTAIAITSAVNAIPFFEGATPTLAAMQEAVTQFQAHGRPNANQVVLLITDGKPNPSVSQNPCSTTTSAAATLRANLAAANISTIILGVGTDVDANTLGCLTNNDPTHFIALSDFTTVSAGLQSAVQLTTAATSVIYAAHIPREQVPNLPNLPPSDIDGALLIGSPTVDVGTVFVDTFGDLQWTIGTGDGKPHQLTITYAISPTVCGVKPILTGQEVLYLLGSNPGGGVSIPNAGTTVDTCDTTPPVISVVNVGTLGTNGWYTSPVTMQWSVTDPESGIGQEIGCGTDGASVGGSGQFVLLCVAKNRAGLGASKFDTLDIDPVAPSVTQTVNGMMGPNGWFTSDVSVSFETTYGVSGAGPSTGCDGTTIVNADTPGRDVTCKAVSLAGLSTTQTVHVKRDVTKPVITFSGNAGSYGVDQTVSISCFATDATSGVATSSCSSSFGPAYNFALGANSVSASATDNAGNSASASASFTVKLTTAGFANLVNQFVKGKSLKTLLNRMDNISDKVAKGNPSVDSQITNFLKELNDAQNAGDVSAANATVLARLVQLFNP